MKDDEAALYDLAMALYRDKKVSDDVYRATQQKFGERGNGYHRPDRLLRPGLDDADHDAGRSAERQRAAACRQIAPLKFRRSCPPRTMYRTADISSRAP